MRIDEGTRFGQIYSPKTDASAAPVYLPISIAVELETLQAAVKPSDQDFIFPNSAGGVARLDNFRHRVLGPAAKRAGLAGITFQAMRRTCATMISSHATIKDVQSVLRHARASTTLGIYVQEIPASVRAAVEQLDLMLHGAVMAHGATAGEPAAKSIPAAEITGTGEGAV